MFFIGGVSSRTKILDQEPGLCPNCGLARVHPRRVDQYIDLFFIPVLRIKKGEPFLYCDRCEGIISEDQFLSSTEPRPPGDACGFCGKTVDKKFRYCPYCGKPT